MDKLQYWTIGVGVGISGHAESGDATVDDIILFVILTYVFRLGWQAVTEPFGFSSWFKADLRFLIGLQNRKCILAPRREHSMLVLLRKGYNLVTARLRRFCPYPSSQPRNRKPKFTVGLMAPLIMSHSCNIHDTFP